MGIPFGRETFFAVFAAYNAALWPAQVVLAVAALVAVAAAAAPGRRRSVLAAGLLTLLWAWTAVAYHWLHFTRINPAAWAFGALSLVEAALVAWQGVVRDRLAFGDRRGWRGGVGWALAAYAVVVYPLLGLAGEHSVRELPVMGVPCPTTILTLGLLFWARRPLPRHLLAIPLLWSAIGSTAAFALGVPQDLGLLVAGLLGLGLLAPRGKVRRPAP